MWGTSLERCSYGIFVIDWSVSWISLNPWQLQFTFAWCCSVHPRSSRPQGNHRSGPPFLQWARSFGWPPWRAVSPVVWSGRASQASGRCPGRPLWVGPQCWPTPSQLTSSRGRTRGGSSCYPKKALVITSSLFHLVHFYYESTSSLSSLSFFWLQLSLYHIFLEQNSY